MIGELALSRGYSSFWGSITPVCDLFVRRINLGEYARIDVPMNTDVSPARRALVNESAFSAFAAVVREFQVSGVISEREIDIDAASNVARSKLRFLDVHDNIAPKLADNEKRDALEQIRRIISAIGGESGLARSVVEPDFPGCGFVNHCVGDLIVEDTLYEIKAGDRHFRSIDIRQLLVYAALNFAAQKYNIERIGIINPRTGVIFSMSIETACGEVSGRSATELLSDVIYYISSGETSR